MGFKEYYTEGRNFWALFSIKKCNERWSILNIETNNRYYIKLGEDSNSIEGMQKFLESINATPASKPKTQGKIDFYEFAQNVMTNQKALIYIKSGNWDKIKQTWTLEK